MKHPLDYLSECFCLWQDALATGCICKKKRHENFKVFGTTKVYQVDATCNSLRNNISAVLFTTEVTNACYTYLDYMSVCFCLWQDALATCSICEKKSQGNVQVFGTTNVYQVDATLCTLRNGFGAILFYIYRLIHVKLDYAICQCVFAKIFMIFSHQFYPSWDRLVKDKNTLTNRLLTFNMN